VITPGRMRQAGHMTRSGDGRGAEHGFSEETGEKEPLERSRRRWEDNIKMYLQDVRWGHGLD